MNRSRQTIVAVLFLFLAYASPSLAQSSEPRFQAGVQLATPFSSEFDKTDVGFGGRLSWQPSSLVGVEGELNFYPQDFAKRPAFSASRTEGLFGLTVGPRLGNVRPFAKFRPGFLSFAEAPAPFPCILIFPPPLRCSIGGKTVPAFDLGGGVEWLASSRTFFRVDAGDRMLRYPGPSIDRSGERRDDDGFVSHDLRFAFGAGLRF